MEYIELYLSLSLSFSLCLSLLIDLYIYLLFIWFLYFFNHIRIQIYNRIDGKISMVLRTMWRPIHLRLLQHSQVQL